MRPQGLGFRLKTFRVLGFGFWVDREGRGEGCRGVGLRVQEVWGLKLYIVGVIGLSFRLCCLARVGTQDSVEWTCVSKY